jgi:hypothetical protein
MYIALMTTDCNSSRHISSWLTKTFLVTPQPSLPPKGIKKETGGLGR